MTILMPLGIAIKGSILTESNQPESRKIMRVIIGEKNIVAQEDSISVAPRRSHPPRVAITTRILWFELRWLLSIGAARCDCQRPSNRFCASLSAEQKPARADTTSARTNVDDDGGGRRTRKSWFSTSGRTFSMRATNQCAIGMYEGNPTRPRRLPLVGRVCGGIDSDTSVWDIELFFCIDRCLPSRLRPAVVIRRSIQVCKDRVLQRRRILSWTNVWVSKLIRDSCASFLLYYCHAGNSERNMRKFKIEKWIRDGIDVMELSILILNAVFKTIHELHACIK